MKRLAPPPMVAGRYVLGAEVASGGMATVHLGQQLGAVGFARVVAIKRLHAERSADPDFVAMFVDEARLAARVRHPHVVATLDVVSDAGELFLVMEYVEGESLWALLRGVGARGSTVPPAIAAAVAVGALSGLQAAHEAVDESGQPLGIVHRDVSPQNVLVGTDGIARVLDFGIAKANVKMHATRAGQTKGKLAYMAPEQIESDTTSSVSDVYAAGIVLWEALAGKRLFAASNEGALVARVLEGRIPPLEEVAPWVPGALAAVVRRATRRAPGERFASAREMAWAIEQSLPLASAREVGAWVRQIAHQALAERSLAVAALERSGPGGARSAPPGPRSADAAPQPRAHPAGAAAPEPSGRSSPPLALSIPRADPPRTETVAGPLRQHRRGRWTLMVPAVLVAVVLLGTTVWAARGRSSAPAGPGPSTRPDDEAAVDRAPALEATATPSAPAGSAVASTGNPPGGPTATAIAEAGAVTSASSIPEPEVAPVAAPHPLVAPSRPRVATPRESASAVVPVRAPSCDPPYYLDGEGIQRVRRECLGKVP